MTDAMAENSARIDELTKTPPVTRSKRVKWLDYARNVALAVALIALGLSVWTQSQRSTAACEESNRVRAQTVALWQYVIQSSQKANPHPTVKQAQSLADFRLKVIETYAPRKC